MLTSFVVILCIGIFIYLFRGIIKKGNSWKERVVYFIAAFIGVPIFMTVMMLIATTIDPMITQERREEALLKAAATDNNQEIIDLLYDYRDHEDVLPVISAAMRRAVASIPASEIDENLKRYRELADLLPDDKSISDKVTYYADLVNERELAAEREQERIRIEVEETRRKEQEERDAAAEQRRTADELKSKQVVLCQMTIEQSAKFPSEVDFEWGYDYGRIEGGGHAVLGRVRLMNVFGNMIPHKYQCDFLDTVLLDFRVEPG